MNRRLLLLAPLALGGCSILLADRHEHFPDEVVLRSNAGKNSGSFPYVLVVTWRVTGRGGNVHRVGDVSPYEYSQTDYFYLKRMASEVSGSELVFFNGVAAERNLRGSIRFNNQTVDIKIEILVTKRSSESSWISYERNGTYKLRSEQKSTYAPVELSTSEAQPLVDDLIQAIEAAS